MRLLVEMTFFANQVAEPAVLETNFFLFQKPQDFFCVCRVK
jgi:hypothetical protein